jgi:hypothetical protein
LKVDEGFRNFIKNLHIVKEENQGIKIILNNNLRNIKQNGG